MRLIQSRYISTIALALFAMIAFWACSAAKKNSSMSVRQSILRSVYPALTGMTRLLGVNSKILVAGDGVDPKKSVYDIPFELIDGQPASLSSYKGKKIIVVNTRHCNRSMHKENKTWSLLDFLPMTLKSRRKVLMKRLPLFVKKIMEWNFPWP
jgi:hypothetical protein